MTVQAMPMVPNAVSLRMQRFSSMDTRVWNRREHLLEVLAFQIRGVSQVVEALPQFAQPARVQLHQPRLGIELVGEMHVHLMGLSRVGADRLQVVA
jgi:hypothetical protein